MTDTSAIDLATPADETTATEQAAVISAPTPTPSAPVEVSASPLEAEKSAFAKLVSFVEHGIEHLGHEAEAELVALAKKYL